MSKLKASLSLFFGSSFVLVPILPSISSTAAFYTTKNEQPDKSDRGMP
jgi:hypothetical protein